MNKKISSKYKIRFIDCDPLGHLRNSKYLDYMLNAREDHFEMQSPINYAQYTEKTGCAMVVIKNEINYTKEIKYNEIVEINSQLIELGEKTAKIEIEIINERTQKLSALLWCTVINFNLKTRKSETFQNEITDIFKKFLVNIAEENLDERTIKLKN